MSAPASFTPGPWRWFGNTKNHDLYLATEGGGRVFVMNFERWGMHSAQPRFQDREQHLMKPASDLVTYEVEYRRDITGINHPDALLIAGAPGLADATKAALLMLGAPQWGDAEVAKWKALTGKPEATTKALCDVIRAALQKAGVAL